MHNEPKRSTPQTAQQMLAALRASIVAAQVKAYVDGVLNAAARAASERA